MERLLTWFDTFTQNGVISWASFAAIVILTLVFTKIVILTHHSKTIDWTGLITAKGTTNVSLTKVIQLVGGVVGSWVVIKMTLQEKITWDIFSIYLAYTGSIEGFSKFLSAKYGSYGKEEKPELPKVEPPKVEDKKNVLKP